MSGVPEFELPPPSRGRGRGRGGGRGAGRGGAAAEPRPPPKQYTTEEQRSLLEGYTELEPRHWPHVQRGEAVRYYTKEGEFRTGGVVKIPRFRAKGSAPTSPELLMIANEVNEYSTWTVRWDGLSRVFIRPSLAQIIAQEKIRDALTIMNDNTHRLADELKRLHDRLKNAEHALMRLTQAR